MERRRPRIPALGYLPWMDGLRAVAVLAVMQFHEMIVQPRLNMQRWMDSGLLGVDVFFAISGFLITTLLLQEAARRRVIRFGAFYLRRARRLLPALAGVLVAIAVGALFLQHGQQRTHSLERVFITAAYATNWVAALSHFDLSQLNHTWSLATEEQFYLFWPAILAGLLVLARRWRHAVVIGVAAIAVVAIAWPEIAASRKWSADRVYYGLDTHFAGLALGALLGALFVSRLLPQSRAWAVVRRVGGVVGLVGIVVLFHHAPIVNDLGGDPRRTQFELFAFAGAATTLLLWELVSSPDHLGHRILSWSPLVAIGRISYGLYLWDGVVVVGLTPSYMGIHGWPLVLVHLVAVFGLATASWFGIERRFRAKKKGQMPVAATPATPGA